jgi:hypothetical protein
MNTHHVSLSQSFVEIRLVYNVQLEKELTDEECLLVRRGVFIIIGCSPSLSLYLFIINKQKRLKKSLMLVFHLCV